MRTAYLSLGSNLGDREENLLRALRLLEDQRLTVSRVSSVYETEPVELLDQPWFLNIVAEVRTSLEPEELFWRCQQVEGQIGRERRIPKGPRSIDIDILLYEDRVIAGSALAVPHPSMHQRRFVLEPLAELAPDITMPGSTESVGSLLAKLTGQTVRRLGDCID